MKIAASLINLLWSFFILMVFVGMAQSGSPAAIVLLVGAAGYFVIACFAMAQQKWAIIVTAAATALTVVVTAPLVLLNVAMFVLEHPLYQDSPGTIIIVGIYAVVLTLPATVILGLLVLHTIRLYLAARRCEKSDSAAIPRANA
jgi:hypothetical protein